MAKAKKAAKKPAKKAPAKAGGVSKNYVDTKFKSLQQQVEDLVKRVEALEAKLGISEKKEEAVEEAAGGAGETGS
ncbi:hypothetical protein JGI7_02267 [Candidatus Kryptonium thompsonii]|jgi:hypothetical protein|uniref:Uncharacterized protein n=1 Tax=Candidatus Kryptonium thompsonii TaxID=1633631 RepID=A0A0P1MUB1_9BACT|nr:hypothetical protein [Candidatus Kryptonium thompsoni]CUS78619.1 hypothetical protein JGI13_00314 [Candidatus Kryptonium thompsoni]CUS83536.1 hypothetical protein JGI10_00905 [Candidatus Kryptonium thompsoni]CUS85447.1 hypothetical protein JGI14_10217 [Candidatus Kryptonium thompsoni]CUS87916.1 hypothetical protein JGI6_01241 [Candidatus Kryptonium thompsoni]CUS89316.1 hypothetical protein JGI15_10493 [Candidatus Kryptonium thompsoni]